MNECKDPTCQCCHPHWCDLGFAPVGERRLCFECGETSESVEIDRDRLPTKVLAYIAPNAVAWRKVS